MSGVALVTGGSKRIGLAISRRLAAEGFSVAIHVGGSLADGEALAGEIIASGGRACVLAGDLADPDVPKRLVADARAQLGSVTLLVNNASVFEPDGIGEINPALWDLHFAVNLRGPVLLIDAFAAQVVDDGASVVNIVDQRVLRPVPHFLSYGLSKAGLASATVTLAQALAPRIRVNAVGPGPTLANSRQGAEDFAKQAGAVLLQRAVLPEEIAEAVLYLARARSVTGQMIAVDGGQHLAWQTPDVVGIKE